MEEIILRFTTTTELEKMKTIKADETSLNLDLKDIEAIDLLGGVSAVENLSERICVQYIEDLEESCGFVPTVFVLMDLDE